MSKNIFYEFQIMKLEKNPKVFRPSKRDQSPIIRDIS